MPRVTAYLCIMGQRLGLRGKLKPVGRRSESESERGVQFAAPDPKPSDLAMSRLKVR